MNFIPLTYIDLAFASLLMILNAFLSMFLNLNLEKQFLIAATRTVVQLTLIGLVLRTLFSVSSFWLTALFAIIMILFAGYEASARQQRRFSGFWTYGLGTSSMMISGIVITSFALTTQLKPEPWFNPQYSIPLLGMILGNTLTGISLGFNTLISKSLSEKVNIEAQLSLGIEINKALSKVVREAIRTGLIPIINSMSAAGIVFLPGMMTGQILGGIPPVEAVKYQILIMFLIAGGTTIGLICAVYGGAFRLSDKRHRLRLDRLK